MSDNFIEILLVTLEDMVDLISFLGAWLVALSTLSAVNLYLGLRKK